MATGKIFGISLLLVSFVVPAFSVGRPHLDLSNLVRSADVVIIADASPSTSLGTATLITRGSDNVQGHEFAADLRVRTVLKGNCRPVLILKYALPDRFVGYIPLRSGLRMVFLRRSGETYELANPYYPDLPATDTAVSLGDTRTDGEVVGAVFRNLADVIASSAASEADKREVLLINYAIPALDYFDAALKKGIATSSNEQVKEFLQAELLVRGDLSELPKVVQSLLGNRVSPEGKPGLLYAIGSRIQDPRAVPALISMMSSDEGPVRAAASQALWHIADPKTIKTLSRSLTDSNYDVRYYAVRGLAEITGQRQWGPSIPEFEENGDKYLQHWKEWARTH